MLDLVCRERLLLMNQPCFPLNLLINIHSAWGDKLLFQGRPSCSLIVLSHILLGPTFKILEIYSVGKSNVFSKENLVAPFRWWMWCLFVSTLILKHTFILLGFLISWGMDTFAGEAALSKLSPTLTPSYPYLASTLKGKNWLLKSKFYPCRVVPFWFELQEGTQEDTKFSPFGKIAENLTSVSLPLKSYVAVILFTFTCNLFS